MPFSPLRTHFHGSLVIQLRTAPLLILFYYFILISCLFFSKVSKLLSGEKMFCWIEWFQSVTAWLSRSPPINGNNGLCGKRLLGMLLWSKLIQTPINFSENWRPGHRRILWVNIRHFQKLWVWIYPLLPVQGLRQETQAMDTRKKGSSFVPAEQLLGVAVGPGQTQGEERTPSCPFWRISARLP